MNKGIQYSIFNIPNSAKSGFTLVEVLVSLGIFTVLTAVVLANYRAYDTNALFANASEDIVLALRQAQVYGVGVKGTGASFTTPYGVHFDTTTPNKVTIFADRGASPDGKYVSTDDDPIIETVNWGGVVTSMLLKCDGGVCGSNVANVTFRRPNPDAKIYDNLVPHSSLEVEISNSVKTSRILISSTGQISLQ